jgi:class 3 adenylate cyclase
MCGAPLPVAVAEQRERRVVSTLFADVAGFTRRSESLDVEDVEGFLDPYFAVCARKWSERADWSRNSPATG